MSGQLLRGNLDLILLAVLEDGPKYGLQIIAETKSRTDGYFDFREGSLYPALHRLEQAKFLQAEFAPSDSGGPRRRYYHLTESGHKQLAKKRQEFESFNTAVEALWGNA